MSALDAFLTGFFQQTNKIQNDNREQADNYYAQQLERARTVGLTKYKQRKEDAQAASDTAQRLVENASMPPDVAKALARGGLGSLQQAEQLWAKNSEVPMSEDFWRDIYGVAKTASDQGDGDFNSALKQAYEVGTAKPPAQENPDLKTKFGNLFFGNGQMDQAWDKLDRTDVGGVTAGDALRASTADEPSAGIGPNYSKLQQYDDEAKLAKARALAGNKEMSVDAINTLNRVRDEAIKKFRDDQENTDKLDKSQSSTPEYQAQLQARAEEYAASVIQRDFPQYAPQYPWLANRGASDAATGGKMTSDLQTPVTPQPNKVVAPNYSFDIPKGVYPSIRWKTPDGKDVEGKFSRYDPASGNIWYKTPDGKEQRTNISKVGMPGEIAPKSTPEQADATSRLNGALAMSSDPNKTAEFKNNFYLDMFSTPPETIYHPDIGSLKYAGAKEENGTGYFLYEATDDHGQNIIIKVPARYNGTEGGDYWKPESAQRVMQDTQNNSLNESVERTKQMLKSKYGAQ